MGTAPLFAQAQQATINVHVELQGRTNHEGIEVTATSYQEAETTQVTDTAGNALFEVSPGSYSIIASKTLYLPSEAVSIEVGAGEQAEIDLGTLKGGDANRDGRVDFSDFQILLRSFASLSSDPSVGGPSSNWDERADFNADGKVTVADFSILASNFQTGVADTTPPQILQVLPAPGEVVATRHATIAAIVTDARGFSSFETSANQFSKARWCLR